MLRHGRGAAGTSVCGFQGARDRLTRRRADVTCLRCRWEIAKEIHLARGPKVVRKCARAWGWLPFKRAA
jgi:hypothetical protein